MAKRVSKGKAKADLFWVGVATVLVLVLLIEWARHIEQLGPGNPYGNGEQAIGRSLKASRDAAAD